MHVSLILAGVGLTFILKYSYILRQPRKWLSRFSEITQEFVNCCMCMGFWVGFILTYFHILIKHFDTICSIEAFHDSLLNGFIVSIVAFFLDVLLQLLDSADDFLKK